MSATVTAENAAAWPAHSYIERCGELFITPSYAVFLHCTLCDQRYQVYSQFLEHIFACHYAHVEAAAVNLAETVQEEELFVYDECSEDCVRPEEFVEERVTDDESSEDCVRPEEFVEESITDDGNLTSCKDLSETSLQKEPNELVTAGAPATSSSPQQLKNTAPKIRRRVQTDDYSSHKYKCSICGLTFKQAFNWRAHCRRHIEPKRFKCPQCNKAFHTNSELAIHLRRHNGERPYVCTYCGLAFVTHGSMMLHEKKHRDFRPHKCSACDKSFFNAYELREHSVKHTGERNFVCSECNAAFSRRRNLRVHMKLHVNAREYVCNLCDKAFNQKPALWLHRRNKHKILSNSIKVGGDDS